MKYDWGTGISTGDKQVMDGDDRANGTAVAPFFGVCLGESGMLAYIHGEIPRSMTVGTYQTFAQLILGANGHVVSVDDAHCGCPLKETKDCAHVAGLLYLCRRICLESGRFADIEEVPSCTSKACWWNQPTGDVPKDVIIPAKEQDIRKKGKKAPLGKRRLGTQRHRLLRRIVVLEINLERALAAKAKLRITNTKAQWLARKRMAPKGKGEGDEGRAGKKTVTEGMVEGPQGSESIKKSVTGGKENAGERESPAKGKESEKGKERALQIQGE